MKHLLLLLFVTLLPVQKDFYARLSDAALALTKDDVIYSGKYYKIPYPNGDVPKNIGVCTDVVVRAYRKLASTCKRKCMKT